MQRNRTMPLKLVVLISGRGSNLAAIAQAIDSGACNAQLALVVSDRKDAAGLEFARARGVPTALVSLGDHTDRAGWDAALAATVAHAQPELVVLAGFMRVLGPAFLARFPRRVINVHPSLLPLFPGTHGPAKALAAGMRVSGCSVHIVDAGVDTGPIIAQAAVPVVPGDDVAALHERIQQAEHRLFPRVIAAIAAGTIELSPELRVRAPPPAETTLFSLEPSHITP
ncbi:MAG: hypothetical protein RL701_1485 [Pseudomonadota bacterium]